MRRLSVAVLASLGVAFACGGGGDDGDSGSERESGDAPVGDQYDLGGEDGLSGTHDGGSVELTEDQVSTIEDSACAGWSGEGEPLPAVLELVVDVSGSMRDRAPGTRDSKWEVTRAALEEAMDALADDTAVGMLLFPNVPHSTGESRRPRPIEACVGTDALLGIDLLGASDGNHRENVIDLMERAFVGGGTPTYDAYTYALETSLVPYETPLEKFMLLITDGQPTYAESCLGNGRAESNVDPQPVVDAIAAAHEDHGIRTFVIGSPGSEEASKTGRDMRGWLSEAAEVGGTAQVGCDVDGPDYCHLDMTEAPDFSAALREGLSQVIGQIGQCTYALPTPPAGENLDLNAVNLIVHSSEGSKLVLPDNQGSCEEGWQFDEDDNVVLCSATCDEVTGTTGLRVELLFGCASGDIPEIH